MNISGLKHKQPKAKVEKPIMPDADGEFTRLVDMGLKAKQQIDSLGSALSQSKDQLSLNALGYIFRSQAGRHSPEDSVMVNGHTGHAVISVKNAYKLNGDSEAEVRAVLGRYANDFIRKSTTISINASEIPEVAQQFFIDGLIALAKQTDEIFCSTDGDGPVFNAISVSQVPIMDASFHAKRFTLFSPEENMAIHGALPCVISVSFKY